MHLIFDLDGTLVDSRPGILHSLEQAVRSVFPQLDTRQLDFKIGSPVRVILRQALKNASGPELDRLEAAFRAAYDGGGWKLVRLYPGVREGLERFKVAGMSLYIITNKPSLPTGLILKATGIDSFFMEAVSPDTCQPALNEKTEGIRYLMDKYAIQAGDAIYLGDSPDDLAAAQASGLAFIGLEYGYGTFPTSAKSYSTVKSFSELPMNLLPALDRLQDKGEHMINRDIFEELFILELANNHWGNIERGLKIIKEFGTVVRYNDVRAGIKLQLRDVDTFIHKDFLNRDDIRYIKKTLDTRLSREDFAQLVEAIRRNNCVRVATPFDEKSVEYCVELGIEIIKVGSSDVTDWPLLEKIARTRKPVLVSTGGTSLKDIDDMVTFFDNRNIPLAINHCISIYPSEDADLQLNQIDFLRNRYPGHVIGFSTHEYHDWRSSIMIAYAKGARTFERHIDIQSDDRPLSPYCSTPEQIAEWFQAFKKAREICGAPGTEKAPSTQKEIDYLTSLVRGVYASSDLPAGHVLTPDDYYLAIPLQKGQLSCRELLNDQVLAREVKKDAPLMVDSVDSLYNRDDVLRKQLYARGL